MIATTGLWEVFYHFEGGGSPKKNLEKIKLLKISNITPSNETTKLGQQHSKNNGEFLESGLFSTIDTL